MVADAVRCGVNFASGLVTPQISAGAIPTAKLIEVAVVAEAVDEAVVVVEGVVVVVVVVTGATTVSKATYTPRLTRYLANMTAL